MVTFEPVDIENVTTECNGLPEEVSGEPDIDFTNPQDIELEVETPEQELQNSLNQDRQPVKTDIIEVYQEQDQE